MSSWDLLDEKAESELHKTRLLNVEEKPFKRIAKRLGTITSLVADAVQTKSENGENRESSSQESNASQLREDIMLDFAAFDSNIMRLQFLHDANARERERYAEDQQRILSECQGVRGSNALLREQLEEARATLAQRKKFDELADKITSNRLLRPREDQIASLAKLEEECRELERESETYSVTWTERRDQFNRIMEEGMLLRRQIRDEKEEVDRREGMIEGDDDDGDGERGGQTPKNEPSGGATPRIEGDEQAKANGEAGTPQPPASTDMETPAGDTPGPESLRPLPDTSVTVSQNGSRMPSRDVSPMPRAEDTKAESGEDVEMETGESGKTVEEGETTPQPSADVPDSNGDRMEVDN